MLRCLELASKGLGRVAPNPMVGSVIVYNNQIIGEGFHQQFGKAHAEVNALASVNNKALLAEATLYVNLEPCAQVGKTPPCADLIIRQGLKKVVIGAIDPHSKVAGKGIKRMKEAGIEVITGICEAACLSLNEVFYTQHQQNRPFILLKWAQSSSGFFSPEASNHSSPFWITATETKLLTHSLRSASSGILVGAQTLLTDKPALTTRAVYGNNPQIIIIDPELVCKDFILNSTAYSKAIVFYEGNNQLNDNRFIGLSEFNLKAILNELLKKDIQLLMVEGGAYTIKQFIDASLWDEAWVLEGSQSLNNGIPAPVFNEATKQEHFAFGKDMIHIHRPL